MSSVAAGGSALEALLAVVADPKGTQQRIQELGEAEASHDAARQKLEAEHAKAADHAERAEAAAVQAQKDREEAAAHRLAVEGPLMLQQQDLDEREKVLASQEAALKADMEAHAARVSEWGVKHDAREVDIRSREQKLAARETEVSTLAAQLQRRLAAFKALSE